jgi:crotonobetainyl-CoA:carnitine CoA-transferase CaiB-like acyl-CoA transferase
MVATMNQPGAGLVRILGFPGQASSTPPKIERPAPLLGQHTAEILGELGMSQQAIHRLAVDGVIALGEVA